MTGVKKSTVFDNIKCVYDSYGRGREALVFLHGWTCSSGLWSGQSSLFAKYRSIVIDLPGHGRSEAPINIEYSLELSANSVNAVLEAEGITRAVLVGHSMGGPVSSMVLRLFPKKVAGILYVDSFFHLPQSYLSHAERRDLAERLADDKKFRKLLNTFWSPDGKATDDMKDKIVSTMTSTARHVRCNATTTMMQPHAWRWNEVYDIPALHIVTQQYENIDGAWLRHVPRLESRVWKDNGHFLFMEEAERFNGEVEDWIKEQSLLQ